jgi:twinkle protein
MKNRPCPECQKIGHDKDGDHLFLMHDGETWSCRTEYHDEYYERDGKPVAWDDEPDSGPIDVSDFTAAKMRDVSKDTVSKFECKVEFDPATGEQLKHYYPITKNKGRVIVGYKVKTLATKDFKVTPSGISGKGKVVDLFGMRSSPFKPQTIIITEGEQDAMAADEMLSAVHRKMCLSLPFGANSQPILDNIDFLRDADDIVLCPDQDHAGQVIIEKISLMLPGIRVMEFSEKDADEMQRAGKKAEFVDAFAAAKPYTPTAIVTVADIEDEANEPIPWGLSYPFDGLTKLTYGLQSMGIIGIGAGPGTGKTSFMKEIQQHLLFEHKAKIGIFSLEERPAQSLRSLGGRIIGKPVHLPDCVYDAKELADAIKMLQDLVMIYDHRGYKDWEDIENAMGYMAHSGVKYMFIDPLSALVAHLNSSEANDYLNNAMFTLSKLVQQLGITVFHINHLNNPGTGKDHGAGGRVYGSQFTGSRAMWKFSTDLWGLERDQLAEDEMDRNKMTLVVLKNRLAGNTGKVQMRYDKTKGKLEEIGTSASFAAVPAAKPEPGKKGKKGKKAKATKSDVAKDLGF